MNTNETNNGERSLINLITDTLGYFQPNRSHQTVTTNLIRLPYFIPKSCAAKMNVRTFVVESIYSIDRSALMIST